ncbi:MAG TPA: hypothetical protein VH020_08765 [Stellaceae bacterium]|jgi:hypothetical protein|nr:hypothetical protein [Stellaceae bacterium]
MATPKQIGARRMWIRRWLKSGKINEAEAKRMTRELGTATQSRKTGRKIRAASAHAAGENRRMPSPQPVFADASSIVTLQYDPTRFRVELHAIRRKG